MATDIDMDFPTSFTPTTLFKRAVPASMIKEQELVKHPCGHYFQTIPTDNITNLAAIPYEQAETLGYFKIDFLHLSLLDHFSSKEEIRNLLNKQPNWELLQSPVHVEKLFQLHRHYDLLAKIKPQTVIELADCVAMIRPNKRQYIDEYMLNKEKTRPKLYRQKDDDKSSFKRSHSIAYALSIILQLHLIEQQKL